MPRGSTKSGASGRRAKARRDKTSRARPWGAGPGSRAVRDQVLPPRAAVATNGSSASTGGCFSVGVRGATGRALLRLGRSGGDRETQLRHGLLVRLAGHGQLIGVLIMA